MSDGNIVAAKRHLGHSVDRLVNQRPGVHLEATVYAPSLYHCLVSDLSCTQADVRTQAKSQPPLFIDGFQLRVDIDAQTHKWLAVPASTCQRLKLLAGKPWRPQDTELVQGMAQTIDGWCQKIVDMLDPKTRKYLSAACPSCGQSVVYRMDSGDRVRQPALKWAENTGFECQACKASWSPDQTLFFSRLLGFELPKGVLE